MQTKDAESSEGGEDLQTQKVQSGIIEKLKESCKALGLIDSKFEKDKNLMKEVNVIDYFISIMEFYTKNKKIYFTTSVAQFVLMYTQQKQHIKDNEITESVRSFITSLLYSYIKNCVKSKELEQLSRYFSDTDKIPIGVILFHLKFRKTLVNTFIDPRKSGLLENHQIKFEDWSTMVTRFLGTSSISIVGKLVKNYNTQTHIYDKILTNSIDACTLIDICVQQFERSLPPPVTTPIKKEEIQEEKQEIQIQLLQSESPIKQIESPEPGRKSTKAVQKIDSQISQREVPNSYQLKLITQLHEQKYQLLEEKMQQTLLINQTVKLYENLAENYINISQHTKSLQMSVGSILQKLKRGNQLGETDVQKLEELIKFKDFLPEDPRIILQKTGIYEICSIEKK